MGTRSLTFIHESYGDEPVLMCLYRQYDGYPSGLGREIAEFLTGLHLVNGIPVGDKRRMANGMGCLAAQLICRLKQGENSEPEVGNVYVYPTDSENCGEEYIYHIYAEKVSVTECYTGKTITFHDIEKFSQWCTGDNQNFDSVERESTIEEALRKREVTVAFTKNDGSKRIMRCTLNMDLIPEDKHPTGAKKKSEDDSVERDAVAVFDLDKSAWRSFKKSTIFEWK